MQDEIIITEMGERIREVMSANLTENLDGELTLTFETKMKRLSAPVVGTKLTFRGQIYAVSSVRRRISEGRFTLQVSAEHASFVLADEEWDVGEFVYRGAASEALSFILNGTGFTGSVESAVNKNVLFKKNSTVTRRALLSDLCEQTGGELEYDGYAIRLVGHRGTTARYNITDAHRVMDFTVTEDGEGTSYELITDTSEGLAVGDDVTINIGTPFSISANVRIIGISYNPFYAKEVVVQMGEPSKDIVDKIVEDREDVDEMVTAITEIRESNDVNTAQLAILTEWQKTVEDGSIESIASIKQQADENGASIQNLVSWQSTVDDNIDSLESSMAILDMIANENGASISQIVEAVGKNGEVTAASIVAAVNDAGSSVKIKADHVEIDGFVTFEDLSGAGRAAVNGNNISLIAEPDGDSISSLSYWKYRWTDYDPETETADQKMFTIKTIDNESEQADRARYAAVLQTFDGVYEDNKSYQVAMKLISGGDMSLEAAGIIYMYAEDVAQLAAFGNVRIEAVRTYASANKYVPINEKDYVFCTDGIYYGGKKILSV